MGADIVVLGENQSLQFYPVRLDGTNWLAWSRFFLLFIQAWRLQGHFTVGKSKLANINHSG